MRKHLDIELLPADNPRVAAMRDRVATQGGMAYPILFIGDRWEPVEWVAIARVASADVGLATLAPTNELGQGGPHIIGLWVVPGARRRGVGTALLLALAQEAQRRYAVPPTVMCVSPAGLATAQRAEAAGATLIVQSSNGLIDFP